MAGRAPSMSSSICGWGEKITSVETLWMRLAVCLCVFVSVSILSVCLSIRTSDSI